MKMIKTIIKREFLDNILSFKFIACVLVAVVLVSISTIVLSNDYRDRLEDYNKGVAVARENLAKVPVYSYLEVGIFRKPSPLSIFVSGIESKTGNHVYLTHREIPTSLKGGLIKNEFAQIFSFFDLSSVIVIIFTILTILLSYDSISGEKEDGVLSLILSNSLPRYKLLLGKYIGGLVSIVVPLTICFITGILILLFSKEIEVNSDFFLSMFLFYLFAILYLSSILLIGIFVSSRTKSSFNSLIFLLAFYLVAIFLLPVSVRSYVEITGAREAKNYANNVDNFKREMSTKISNVYSDIPVKRSWAAMIMRGYKFILKRINPENTIEFYRRYFSQSQNIVKEYALKIYDLKRIDFQNTEKIKKFQNMFLTFLPSFNFERMAEFEAGTGQDYLNRFFQQLALYWHQYVHYLDEKDAFSLKYFYPFSKEFTLEEQELLIKLDTAFMERDWENRTKYSKEAERYNQNIDYLDLEDLPVFNFYKQNFLDKIKVVIFNILIIFFYNLVFFILAYFSLARYDPRVEA